MRCIEDVNPPVLFCIYLYCVSIRPTCLKYAHIHGTVWLESILDNYFTYCLLFTLVTQSSRGNNSTRLMNTSNTLFMNERSLILAVSANTMSVF